jgi:hypothetical protein
MAYFIFNKYLENQEGSLYRIAENLTDKNNLNIIENDYKIIEDTQEKFLEVKFGKIIVEKYSNNTIFYKELSWNLSKIQFSLHIEQYKKLIQDFLNNNFNHIYFQKWNTYLNQLNNLNLDNIIFPQQKSIEKYFDDLGQPSLNILQLP